MKLLYNYIIKQQYTKYIQYMQVEFDVVYQY